MIKIAVLVNHKRAKRIDERICFCGRRGFGRVGFILLGRDLGQTTELLTLFKELAQPLIFGEMFIHLVLNVLNVNG